MLTADGTALISSLPALVSLGVTQPCSMDDREGAARLTQLRAAFAAQGRVPPAVIEHK